MGLPYTRMIIHIWGSVASNRLKDKKNWS